MILHRFSKNFTLFILIFCTSLIGGEVLVVTEEGRSFYFEIDDRGSLGEIDASITKRLTGNDKIKQLLIEFDSELEHNQNLSDSLDWDLQKHGQYLGYPRNYNAPIKQVEKDDIAYILNCLATKSLISLALHRSSLEAAGDRIDHLHPLRFFHTVFTDEELKVHIRNIRGKGWVWNEFIEGIKESLATETRVGNMKQEHVLHFARSIEMNPDLIWPSIQGARWDEFVDILITQVPRKGNPGRYDN